ncbi:MAG: hypothetical protein RL226_2236, partial [Bacteroidota bacterium]
MGVMIFDRSHSPLTPTPTGLKVIARARKMLMEAEGLFAEIRGIHDSIEGHFRVGVIPTLAPYLLPVFLPSFLEKYPQTRLDVREMQTSMIIKALKEDKIDIGLLVTPLDDDELREIPMFHEPFLFFGPKDHADGEIKPNELPDHGLLLLEEGHCFRSQMLEICSNSSSGVPGLHYLSGSIEALKGLVRQGMGYTLIPSLSAKPEDSSYVRPFAAPVPIREVSIVVHESFVRERVMEIMKEEVLRNLPAGYAKEERHFKVRWRQL